MSGIRLIQVDAFSDRPFSGNPAAICLLEEDVDSEWMQSLAEEMNLSETAFVRPLDEGFGLRWFTPVAEVDLCGHATLASAHVLWSEGLAATDAPIQFHTRSGVLPCRKQGETIELDFPTTPPSEAEPPDGLCDSLGVHPTYCGKTQFDTLLIVETEDTVRSLSPDFTRLREFPTRGIIVSSACRDPAIDFISRYFAPAFGIDEDPVTGSAHCCLGPYWAEELGKTKLNAFQSSQRGGHVRVSVEGGRTLLGGKAVTVMRGEIVKP